MREKVPLRAAFIRLLGLVFILSACMGPENGEIANPVFNDPVPGVTTVNLSWSAVSGATGYTLERQQGSGAFTEVLRNRNQTTYEDTGLNPSTEYTYRLRAEKGTASSSGVERKVTTVAEGSAINISILTPIWRSKQSVNFDNVTEGQEISAVKNAATNVTVSGSSISMSGNGEAMYYLGGQCNRLTGSVTGSGAFKVVADDEQLWTGSTGNFNLESLVGKQNISLVFQGSGTGIWGDAQIYCQDTPTAPSATSPYITGRWGAEFPWGDGEPRGTPGNDPRNPGYYPNGYIVPTHVANLPDGRIVSFSSWREYTYGRKDGENPPFIEQTAGYIWNPGQGATPNTAASSFTPSETLDHDMFCAGLSVLADGRIFAAGGGSTLPGGAVQASQRKTSYFDFRSNSWSAGADGNLASDHWYGTAVALSDERLFVIGGSSSSAKIPTSADIRGPNDSDQWVNSTSNLRGVFPNESDITIENDEVLSPSSTLASSAEFSEAWGWYPYLHVDPDGNMFQSGPIPRFRTLSISGSTVSAADAGDAPPDASQMRTWGNSIMFDEGKILVTGGSVVRGAGATNSGMVIDIGGGNVSADSTFMRFRRANHNGVVLPTGDVLMIGGNNSGKQFTDSGILPDRDTEPTNANYGWESDIFTETVYTPELYSPDKNTWRDLGDMKVPRNYHSVGILLQDGRVLAAGGGLCGEPADGAILGCNHPDGEIFEPPYLFNPSGSLANRPVLQAVPASAGYGQSFNVTLSSLGDSTRITKFSMIKLSAVTHSINTDVRYLEYTPNKGNLSGSGNSYQLTTTGNENILTPGYYFLFAINDKGVPSVAEVIQIN
jgi:hypothetical protein